MSGTSNTTQRASDIVRARASQISDERVLQALQAMAMDHIDDMDVFTEFVETFIKTEGDFEAVAGQTHVPVGVDEFIDDKYFLNMGEHVFPELRKCIKGIVEGGYTEALFMGALGIGKSLSLDTPIPTPRGWTTMGELRVGDTIFSDTGETCTVTGAHDVRLNRNCYRVTFSDRTSIVADEDHLWETQTYADRTAHIPGGKRGLKLYNPLPGSVRTTAEIRDTMFLPNGQKNHSIPLCGPLQIPPRDLVIDPYVMGAWLGDGHSAGSRIVCHDSDVALIDNIRACGYYVSQAQRSVGNCPNYNVYTTHKGECFTSVLARFSLLGNKRVPRDYMRASATQRLSLIQGLMDTDGTVSRSTGVCEFVQVRKIIVDQMMELLRSVGLKPTRVEKVIGGTVYHRVTFTAYRDEVPVFRLARKLALQPVAKKQAIRQRSRYISAVTPVESVPVRCISVDSPSCLFLAGDGMIPTHNSTGAQIVQAYHLYALSCEKWPQAKFGLMPTSTIIFAMLNKTDHLAQQVTYGEFRQFLDPVPYFKEHMPFLSDKKSTMDFPTKRVRVIPSAAYNNKLLGMNIISGVIDELNFMQMIVKSKQSRDGGDFNQAKAIYNALVRRRKSRFLKGGNLPGTICLVSSKGGPDDFTEQRAREAAAEDDKLTYVWNKPQWDVIPAERFSGEKFFLELGDEKTNSRIIEKRSDAAEGSVVIEPPIEFKPEFERDMEGSLRDYAGIATLSKKPFFYSKEKIWRCAELWEAHGMVSPFGTLQQFVVSEHTLPEVLRDYVVPYPDRPRVAHVDLGISSRGDASGLSIGFVQDVQTLRARGRNGELVVEDHPVVAFDLIVQMLAPRGGETEISLIRQVLYVLRDAGLPIELITWDQFQSTDTRQILKRQGFRSELCSIDSDSENIFGGLRSAMYNERVLAPEHMIGFRELSQLEITAPGKVDHLVGSSKDVADSMAGVFTTLMNRRSTWRAVADASVSRGRVFNRRPNPSRPSGATRPLGRPIVDR